MEVNNKNVQIRQENEEKFINEPDKKKKRFIKHYVQKKETKIKRRKRNSK